MSRVGKRPVNIPAGVKVEVNANVVRVEGPKGKLEHRLPESIGAEVKDGKVIVKKKGSGKEERNPLHGLTRTIIFNLIKGVTEGYKKELEIRGVGFKAQAQGNKLQMTLGFSHPIEYEIPEGITVTTPKPVQLVVSGIDKVKVGEVSAELRDFFKAEPYKGKGIRYQGEHIRRKLGKKAAATA